LILTIVFGGAQCAYPLLSGGKINEAGGDMKCTAHSCLATRALNHWTVHMTTHHGQTGWAFDQSNFCANAAANRTAGQVFSILITAS
jgi:hypothetical protein